MSVEEMTRFLVNAGCPTLPTSTCATTTSPPSAPSCSPGLSTLWRTVTLDTQISHQSRYNCSWINLILNHMRSNTDPGVCLVFLDGCRDSIEKVEHSRKQPQVRCPRLVGQTVEQVMILSDCHLSQVPQLCTCGSGNLTSSQ